MHGNVPPLVFLAVREKHAGVNPIFLNYIVFVGTGTTRKAQEKRVFGVTYARSLVLRVGC